MVLGQLLYMTLARPDVSVPPDAAPISKKQEKKLQQQVKRIGKQYNLAWSIMSENLLYNLEFVEDFDILVRFVLTSV